MFEAGAKQFERWVQGRISQENESHTWLEDGSPGFRDNPRIGTTRNGGKMDWLVKAFLCGLLSYESLHCNKNITFSFDESLSH